MPTSQDPDKPKRQYFKSYLQVIRNSVGANLFRNFYVSTKSRGEFDAMEDGVFSCALFVSSVLVLFSKLSGVHGTVASTIKDIEKSEWKKVEVPKPGDVLVWERQEIDGELIEHIGFYIGEGKAISNSMIKRTPVEHDKNFSDTKPRKIIQIFRMDNWEDDRPQNG